MLSQEQLEQYLADKNYDAAKQMIQEYLSQESSPTERAEAMALIAQVYMQTISDANEQYLEASTPLVEALQDLQTIESDTNDALGMIDARKSLQ